MSPPGSQQIDSFTDLDPVEQEMGVRVEEMVPDQLVAYLKSHQQRLGIRRPTEEQDRWPTFRRLQNHYGQQDAGRIVKWAFSPYGHAGHYDGWPITYFSFTKDREWLTDRLLRELRMYLANNPDTREPSM